MAETWDPKDKYAPDGHDHDERYSKVGHSHDGIGDLPAHNHDDRYSLKDHNHDDDYAPYDHDHDDKYIKTEDVAAYVIESKNNIEKYTDDNKTLISRSWYRKWSDGTLEQGGWYWGKEVDGDACTIVNLAVSFVDNVYQVFFTACTDTAVGGSTRYHHNVYLKSTTSFYVQDNMLMGYTGLDWYARGTYKTTATS